jgi:general secretion pathway protein I
MTTRTDRPQAGFTLLEAIVAIAVLAAALVPLYMLISSVSRSAFRVDQANRRAEIETDALNIMSTINPMDKPSGSLDLGPYAVRWTAQPVLAPIDGSSYPSGVSAFKIGLFNAKIDVARPDGQILVSFPLRMIGYSHVRNALFH